jgi:hypothetical protein
MNTLNASNIVNTSNTLNASAIRKALPDITPDNAVSH